MDRPAERLTPRELECLRLLSEGEQAKRIAHILGITRKTAEHYLSDAKRKLRARTATHAVAIAIARGLL